MSEQGLKQSLNPECQPRFLVLFLLPHAASSGWHYVDKNKQTNRKKKTSQSKYVILLTMIHWSRLLMSCVLPGYQFRKCSLVYSHEVDAVMVFPSAVLGKNWVSIDTTETLLFPKYSFSLDDANFPMRNRKGANFSAGPFKLFPRTRGCLGKLQDLPCSFCHALGCRAFLLPPYPNHHLSTASHPLPQQEDVFKKTLHLLPW